MSVIIILLVVALFISGSFLFAFAWANKRGQFDDIDSPSVKILSDGYIKTK